MPGNYKFAYGDSTVYGNICRLVREFSRPGAVHLDIGCGYGTIAEPLRDAGLTYVGFDLDKDSIEDLRVRGFEAHLIDLEDLDAARRVLLDELGDRTLGSISFLDTLEHLTDGAEVLGLLREIALTGAAVPLVVSVPNVAHRDVAIKLLTNRWEYTETGLLDQTHIRFYTADSLEQTMQRTGWTQVGEEDFRLDRSDQYFPTGSIALSSKTVLGDFLNELRDRAGYGATVNQFVRSYLPRTPKPLPAVSDRSDTADFSLSVLVRTQGRRPHTLRDALLCLLAQTNQDFEVIVLAHRVSDEEQLVVESAVEELPESLRSRTRVVVVPEGRRARPLNCGIDQARGRYIAVLDDDDTVFANWVETFVELAAARPGRLLRAVAVSQAIVGQKWSDGQPGFRTLGPTVEEFAKSFDLIDHLVMNRSPFMIWAFPTDLFRHLGVRFNEHLDVCEDWDVLLRAVMLCGVAESSNVTALYRRWQDSDGSRLVHPPDAWARAAGGIMARIEEKPTLLPPGQLSRVRDLKISHDLLAEGNAELQRTVADLQGANAQIQLQLAATQAYVDELKVSTSWRVTAPLRAASDFVLRRKGPATS